MSKSMAIEDSINEVIDVAQRLYGRVPHITRLISNNNFVYRLDFESGLSSKVIKLAGSGDGAPESIRREQQALRALSGHGIDVPPIEFTQDDLPQGPKPFTIMPLLPGTTLSEACRSQTPWAGDGCRWAGRFVHRIGAVPMEALPTIGRPRDDQAFLSYVQKNFDAEKMVIPPFSTILEEAQRLLRSPVRQLIHGDYSWGQIITDGHRFAVIDWESVIVGHPLNMLGRAVAMSREYGGTQRHIEMFIEGYEQEQALTDADRRDLHLWEMWHHVGCMGWKFVCGSDHRSHAFAMAERVKGWAKV